MEDVDANHKPIPPETEGTEILAKYPSDKPTPSAIEELETLAGHPNAVGSSMLPAFEILGRFQFLNQGSDWQTIRPVLQIPQRDFFPAEIGGATHQSTLLLQYSSGTYASDTQFYISDYYNADSHLSVRAYDNETKPILTYDFEIASTKWMLTPVWRHDNAGLWCATYGGYQYYPGHCTSLDNYAGCNDYIWSGPWGGYQGFEWQMISQ